MQRAACHTFGFIRAWQRGSEDKVTEYFREGVAVQERGAHHGVRTARWQKGALYWSARDVWSEPALRERQARELAVPEADSREKCSDVYL